MLLAHIRQNFEAAFYPRLSEWAAAAVTLLSGVVLTQNEKLMASAPLGYSTMTDIMSQQSWAVLFILLGFVRLLVLLVNGAIKKSPWVRAAAAFLTCGLWGALFASFMSVYGLGMVMAAGYIAMDYMNIVRAMRDARAMNDATARGHHAGSTRYR